MSAERTSTKARREIRLRDTHAAVGRHSWDEAQARALLIIAELLSEVLDRMDSNED